MTSLKLNDIAVGYGNKVVGETIEGVVEFVIEAAFQVGVEVLSSALSSLDF